MNLIIKGRGGKSFSVISLFYVTFVALLRASRMYEYNHSICLVSKASLQYDVRTVHGFILYVKSTASIHTFKEQEKLCGNNLDI